MMKMTTATNMTAPVAAKAPMTGKVKILEPESPPPVLGSTGVVVRGEGGAVVEGPSGLVAGQPSRKDEVLTQRGGPSLPVSDGFDRVSAQKIIAVSLGAKKLVALTYHIQQ